MKLSQDSADRGAGSGCHARLVGCSSLWSRVNHWWFWVSQIIGLGLVIYQNRLLNDSLQITIVTVYFCSVNSYLGGLLTFELLSQPIRDDRRRNSHNSGDNDGDRLTRSEVPTLNNGAKTNGDTFGGALLENERNGREVSDNGDHGSEYSSTNVERMHPS
jgi:hypothetical protein